MAKITVIGAGGWGTALALMCDRNGHQVVLWSCFEEEIAAIRRHGEHKKLLPGVPVPSSVSLTTDITSAADADLVIMAVPSFAIEETAQKLSAILPSGALVANAGKGIDAVTYRRFSEILIAALPQARVAVLSGPSHAEEVARGVPTSLVSASEDEETARAVQELLVNPQFRVYVNTDVVGVELGGAFKNVIALAAGICDGLDLGDNAKAALMTRGLSETARLGMALGGRSETFAGLAGMGDLIVTCGSMHSRNRRAGILIGQGVPIPEVIARVGTVEGYLAARAAHGLAARVGAELPITEQCYRICYEGQNAAEALSALMNRPCGAEVDRNWLQ